MGRKKKKASGIGWIKLVLELFVVFAGVTAGFILNNFREEQVNRKFEAIYLENLLVNLAADSVQIVGNIESNRNNVEIAREAVKSFQDIGITSDLALEALSVMVTYNDISLQDAAYQSIVGSGNLGLISDLEFRNKLIAYYQFLEQVRKVEAVHNDYITSYVLPFVMKNMDMTSGRLNKDFDLDNIEFRNLTAGYYVLENQKMELSLRLDSLNNQLISILKDQKRDK